MHGDSGMGMVGGGRSNQLRESTIMYMDKDELCNGISRTNLTMKEKDRDKAASNEKKARTK